MLNRTYGIPIPTNIDIIRYKQKESVNKGKKNDIPITYIRKFNI